MKKSNLLDLAKYLNLSPSTISRALADHQDISVATKKRVKEAAAFFNYVPNLHARFFRKKNSNLIALILPDVNNFFIPELIRGINDVFNQKDYTIITFFSKDKLQNEKEIINYCLSWLAEGVLLSVSDETKNLEHLEILSQNNIPVVLLDKILPTEKHSLVHINDVNTAFEGTKFLINSGCKNILGVFANPDVKMVNDRIQGFKDALQQLGPGFDNEKNLFTNPVLDHFETMLKTKLNLFQYDGCFIMSDELVFLAHPILVDKKLIPDKMKILTISDGQIIKSLRPEISYIYHNGYDIGKKAASVLIDHLRDKSLGQSNEILSTTLFA
jgi:LacI family transcriptional regulator